MYKDLWFDILSNCFPLMLKQIINVLCLKEDIASKRNMNSFVSAVGLRNRELASKSIQIESFLEVDDNKCLV